MARTYFVIKTPTGLVAGVSKVRKAVKTTKRERFIKSFATFESAHNFVEMYVHSGYGMSASEVAIFPFSK